MKKIFAILLAFAFVMCLSACEDSAAPTGGATTETAAIAPEESPEEETEESLEEAPEDDFAPAESEQFVTGTVVYYDGSMLYICTLDNRSLNFFVADSEIDMNETRGLKTGSETDIYYAGEISGHDTSAARVTRLVQSPEQAAARTDISVTAAVIANVNDYELTVMTFDGAFLAFSIAGDDIDTTHTGELTAEHYVMVFYEGEIDGENTEAVRVVRIVQ